MRFSVASLLIDCDSLHDGASNDPAHFQNQREFNIDRHNVRDHNGLSKGLHTCIGTPLGRLELRIAIERFLARAGDIRIDE